MVTDLQSDVKGLITKFGNNSDRLNEVLISVNELVNDPQMKMDLKSTISNFEVTSRNLNSLVSENRTNLNSITNKVGRTVDNVSSLVDETSPEFKRTFANIQDMTTRVDSLIGNLNTIVSDIKEQRAGVGKFIYDEKFFRNINTTLEEVEKLTRQIRKDGVKINLF
jgi:phospholipid/cholesterol/gamma-HCH transport system substrate-binding protein